MYGIEERILARKGFTLLEILLVVAAIAILAGVVIIAINPAKQLADVRNAQRQTDVKTVLDAVYQYSIDNNGNLPTGITTNLAMIGTDGSGCDIECGAVESHTGSTADDTKQEFDLGDYYQPPLLDPETQYDAVNGYLELYNPLSTQTGRYASSVKDAAGETYWQTLSWVPQRPTFKELPDGAQSESGYPDGNANMTGNVLLMHMNDNVAGNGQPISDTSGQANNGMIIGDTNCTISGRLDGGCYFDGTGAYIQANGVSADVANKNHTVLGWVKSSISTGQQFVFAFNTSTGDNRLMLGHQSGDNRLSLYDSTAWRTTSSVMVDGSWHQIGYVFNDTLNVVDIIFDGASVMSYASTTSIAASDLCAIGMEYDGGPSPSDYWNGYTDELSIWSRALNITEVQDLYLRGATKIMLGVTSCALANCSDGGAFSGNYSEITNTGLTPPSITLSVTNNRYFQYQATLETLSTSYSPELVSVSTTYAVGGAAGETTESACLDLSTILAPEYITDIPIDPSDGSSGKTYYAIRDTGEGRITVKACTVEQEDRVSMTR
ncbi:MAG: LamG-like jellyroll fold domain-containing protein [bacterium]